MLLFAHLSCTYLEFLSDQFSVCALIFKVTEKFTDYDFMIKIKR